MMWLLIPLVIFLIWQRSLAMRIIEWGDGLTHALKVIGILYGMWKVMESIKTADNLPTLINTLLPSLAPTRASTRKVSTTMKKHVAASQQWSCSRCRNMLSASYEIDYIVPLHQNGTNDFSNLQALCRECHGQKTAQDSF